MSLYLGLVHYPVYNRNHEKIASAVTTLDIHDIARISRAYGIERFFVITPLTDQAELVKNIVRHWTSGYGARYNHHRKEAIELVEVVGHIKDAIDKIEKEGGSYPIVVATSAKRHSSSLISFADLAGIIAKGSDVFILFGTAWGLEKSVFLLADYVLEPVSGLTDYRHISVRSAASIIVDRLASYIQNMAKSERPVEPK